MPSLAHIPPLSLVCFALLTPLRSVVWGVESNGRNVAAHPFFDVNEVEHCCHVRAPCLPQDVHASSNLSFLPDSRRPSLPDSKRDRVSAETLWASTLALPDSKRAHAESLGSSNIRRGRHMAALMGSS